MLIVTGGKATVLLGCWRSDGEGGWERLVHAGFDSVFKNEWVELCQGVSGGGLVGETAT